LSNQQSTSVTQVMVRGISERMRSVRGQLRLPRVSKPSPVCVSRASKLSPFRLSRLSKPSPLDWENTAGEHDLQLENDQVTLRDLEAEIYSLTDQFNTEEGLPRASSV